MLEFLLVIIGLVVLDSFFFKGKTKPFETPTTQPSDERTFQSYERAASLFVNASEHTLFHMLHSGMPYGYHLMTKTRLEDIVKVKKGFDKKTLWSLRGRIKSRHVDYLIMDSQGVPRIAIELDGKSHGKAAANADALKDGIFAHVGIPLIRVRTGDDFNQAIHAILARL